MNLFLVWQDRALSVNINTRNIDKRVSDIQFRIRFRSKPVCGYPYPVANSLHCRLSNRQTG